MKMYVTFWICMLCMAMYVTFWNCVYVMYGNVCNVLELCVCDVWKCL
jgi:hypothetical protein